MDGAGDGRGVLYPARLPTFHREPAPSTLQERVRWFWVPRWWLPPGVTSRQHLLAFPASNLVVGPAGVTLSGPSTRASHRDLSGEGWAVGALLRPAGLACLPVAPRDVRDVEVPVDVPALHRAVVGAMRDPHEDVARRAAVAAFAAWAHEHLHPPGEAALLANALEDAVAGDRGLVRVDQLAQRLGVSTRTVQRLADRYVGLPPLAVIRRYRLQEAAQRLRDDPAVSIAEVAADLGYADQAHLSTDFRAVLGATPRNYRRGAAHGPVP